MKGIFLDVATLGQDIDLTPLKESPVDWTYYPNLANNEALSKIQAADILISNKVVLDAPTLARIRPKCILVSATGTDHIDLDAARQLGIVVSNVRGYSSASVAQHTLGLMIALASQLVPYTLDVRAGEWAASPYFCFHRFPSFELSGKTLGIIGYGAIGRLVEQGALALGMKVLTASARNGPSRLSVQALLPQVDVLSLHCPLTTETYHLIDASALSLMKKTALLINCSRGGLIDAAALARALLSHSLGGAGLDVLEMEPPTSDPLLAQPIPNLLVTPHVAWATYESKQRLIQELSLNLKAFLDAKPRNVIL